jgi:DNA invertase Pin-like site-specific DNA recombinase
LRSKKPFCKVLNGRIVTYIGWDGGDYERQICRLLPGFDRQAGQIRPWPRRPAPGRRNYLNGGNWKLISEFTEVDRPQLRAAQAACKKHKAKLVIAKLDRLSRNVAFIANLLEAGTDFVAADNPHANKPMVQMMAVFAEMERDAISKRTKEALAPARARGVRLGNPRLAQARAEVNAARQEAADSFAAGVLPIIKQIQKSGVSSLRGVAKALSARGVKTARGGEWTAVQVSDVLRRA